LAVVSVSTSSYDRKVPDCFGAVLGADVGLEFCDEVADPEVDVGTLEVAGVLAADEHPERASPIADAKTRHTTKRFTVIPPWNM